MSPAFPPRLSAVRARGCGLLVADLEDRDAARRDEAWQIGDDRAIRVEPGRPGIERGGGFVVVDLARQGFERADIRRVGEDEIERTGDARRPIDRKSTRLNSSH